MSWSFPKPQFFNGWITKLCKECSKLYRFFFKNRYSRIFHGHFKFLTYQSVTLGCQDWRRRFTLVLINAVTYFHHPFEVSFPCDIRYTYTIFSLNLCYILLIDIRRQLFDIKHNVIVLQDEVATVQNVSSRRWLNS